MSEVFEDFYTTEQAAAYLGLKPGSVRYHIYTSKQLTPHRIGKTFFFTQVELDRFQATKRRAGRRC